MVITKTEFPGATICLTSQVGGSRIPIKKSAVKKMMTKEEKKDGAVPDMSIKNEAAK